MILREVNRIFVDKSQKRDDFVSKFEKSVIRKSKVSSFAESWKDINDALFYEDLVVYRNEFGLEITE